MKIYRPVQPESDIQNHVRVALSKHGCVFRTNAGRAYQGKMVYSQEFKQMVLTDIHPVSLLAPGFSDLLFVGQNRTAFIEIKKPGEKPRPDQVNFLDRMTSLGHIAGVARSTEDALRLIWVDV